MSILVSGYSNQVAMVPAAAAATGPNLVSLRVNPSQANLLVGQGQAFTCLGVYDDGSTKDLITVVSWVISANSAPAASSITSVGFFVSQAAGTFTVRAGYNNIYEVAQINVTTGLATLYAIKIIPNPSTVRIGSTLQYQAIGIDTNGNQIPVAVTFSVGSLLADHSSWPDMAGSITPNGLFTPTRIQDFSVPTNLVTFVFAKAISNPNIQAFVQPTILPSLGGINDIVSLAVSPASANVILSTTQTFTVVGTDSIGNQFQNPPVIWSVINTDGAGTISQSGVFTGTVIGNTIQVVATLQSNSKVKGTANVNVSNVNIPAPPPPTNTVIPPGAAPYLVSLSINPSSAIVVAGNTQQFTAIGTDNQGNTRKPACNWTIQNISGSGTVDNSGLFLGQRAGSNVVITATLPAGQVSSQVTSQQITGGSSNPSFTYDPVNKVKTFQGSAVSYNTPATTAAPVSLGSALVLNLTNVTTVQGTAGDSYIVVELHGPDGSLINTYNLSSQIQRIVNGQQTGIAGVQASNTAQVTYYDRGAVQGQYTWKIYGIANASYGLATNSLQFIAYNFTVGWAGNYSWTDKTTITFQNLTASASIVVVAGQPVRIGVTPVNVQMNNGQSQQFTAIGYDSYSNSVSLTSPAPTWSVTAGIGNINTSGLFTASQSGAGRAIATWNGISGFGSVNVLRYVGGVTANQVSQQPFARVYVRDPLVEPVVIDSRQRGGGLQHTTALPPTDDFWWDLTSYDGHPFQPYGAYVVNITLPPGSSQITAANLSNSRISEVLNKYAAPQNLGLIMPQLAPPANN